MCLLVPALYKADVLKHWWLVEDLRGCRGSTQNQRPVEKERQAERELIPQWKSIDPASSGLLRGSELGKSLRILKLIIIEKPLLMITATGKYVL